MNYKKHLPIFLIGLVSILLNFFLHSVGAFSLIETKLYDFRFKLRGPLNEVRNENKQDVVIVEIDDESYKLISESYPYSRGRVWSKVVKNLSEAGAKVIVFDIMFDAPDHTSKMLENYLTKDCIDCSFIDGDGVFVNSINSAKSAGTSVVLASKIAYDANRIPYDYIINPTSKIMKSNVDIGLVNQEADLVDHVIKRYPLFYKLSTEPDNLYLSLAVQSVLSYKNISERTIKQDVRNNMFIINDIKIKTFKKEASFLINYYGPKSSIFNTFKRYSLYEVIDTEEYDLSNLDEDDNWMSKYIDKNNFNYKRFGLDRSPFKNKIVIIGSSLEEDNDFVITPFYNYMGIDNMMPGVELHANAIQQVIDEDYFTLPLKSLKLSDLNFFYQIIILLGLTLVGLFACNRNSLFSSILLTLSFIIIWLSVSIGVFVNDHLWIPKTIYNLFSSTNLKLNMLSIGDSILVPVFYPIASIISTFGINLSYKLFLEQKDKNFLKETFGKYVSPTLIDEMYDSKKIPELGGESGIRTAFFSDIQSFSTISEKMTSTELVELLNDFLSNLTEIIITKNGTLDKYEGDAILAFFGAPVFFDEHSKAAIDAGVEMQNKLVELCEKWKNQKKWPLMVNNMKMRIGINTGEMVTGNMGSKHHMNYTMMGDVVNTAARLESSAKQYGIYFHTTEETLQKASENRYSWRYIDRVQFVGKTVWIQTVEVLGYKNEETDNVNKMIKNFNKGLDYYYDQKWDEAIQHFEISKKFETNSEKNHINPSRVFIKRAEEFKQFPPRKGWRGAFVLSSK